MQDVSQLHEGALSTYVAPASSKTAAVQQGPLQASRLPGFPFRQRNFSASKRLLSFMHCSYIDPGTVCYPETLVK